jgi:RNA polymerase sigma-70 factor (ECF subfamily)
MRNAESTKAMDRYASGDDGAFPALYDSLAPRLHRYLSRQTGDAARAEDLVQQTMLQIHCCRDRFLLGADVAPWAFAIARRLLIDTIRQRNAERVRDERLQTVEPDNDVGADELLHSKRLALRLQSELSRLPDSQRVAFVMLKEEGLSLREVAAALGTTADAIKLRAHRAYVSLRSSLAEERAETD